MENLYDVLIIGAGPAGMTAGIYAKRAELSVAIIEGTGIYGGQILNTYEVENYPGFESISGLELGDKFRAHAEKFGVPFIDENVTKITDADKIKEVTLENGDVLRTKAVILATGARNRKLEVEGEERLSGCGVSYCATCDGGFFKNKEVVVCGGGNTAVEDGIFLSRICKKVYVIHRREEFRADKTLVGKLKSCPNVEILWNTKVTAINGNEQVESVTVTNTKDTTDEDENQTISVDGVFVAIGTVPESELYVGLASLDEAGYVVANEDCKTGTFGLFVAGDVRKKPIKQVITAASDGANAVNSVVEFLNAY
ncbi:MAG: thioredoxin-disulfide reductase [Lachnospiraceae bacterium]|nr:thioredoxin-disulfide reductase [Lachnospiraceae bacterium]